MVAGLPACDTAASADREQTSPEHTAERLLADSAEGDAAALAALPQRLREDLDISAVLRPEVLADGGRAGCLLMPASVDAEDRRRLNVLLPDGGRALLHVRSRPETGELRRVELARRRADDAGQRVFVWDHVDDELRSLEWEPGERRARRQPEAVVLPRGGPAPRALRALARRLLVLPCTTAHRIIINPEEDR